MQQILLKLKANINNYKVDAFGNNERCYYFIKNKNDCICIYTNSKNLLIILSPLENEFNSKIYYKIDTCQREYILNFNFFNIKRENLYTFYLTDSVYGLKINGNLLFN